ncbi:formate dehydrogenase accessory sulfurtransferase FdhD [Bradyrhizobium guangdongense]
MFCISMHRWTASRISATCDWLSLIVLHRRDRRLSARWRVQLRNPRHAEAFHPGAEDSRIGGAVIVPISAPTALAIRTAEAAGLTLIGIARGSDFEIFSHPVGICR